MAHIGKRSHCLVEVLVRHREFARFSALAGKDFVDLFRPAEESNFVFVKSSHFFSAIHFFALVLLILRTCLIQIHKSERGKQEHARVPAIRIGLFLIRMLCSCNASDLSRQNSALDVVVRAHKSIEMLDTQSGQHFKIIIRTLKIKVSLARNGELCSGNARCGCPLLLCFQGRPYHTNARGYGKPIHVPASE